MLENAIQNLDQLKENNWVLALLALLPAIVLCVYIYIKDRVEKEPIGLLLGLFGLGVLSCVPAVILESIASPVIEGVFSVFGTDYEVDGVVYTVLSDGWYNVYCAVDAFIGVALMEELSKWVMLVLLTRKNKNFNCLFDGIVYAVFVSLGFAALENVLYAFEYGFDTVLMRAVTSIPGHMFFGVFMGMYYSLARLDRELQSAENALAAQGKIAIRQPYNPSTNMWKSLLMPILVHGFYDFCLFTGEWYFVIIFYIFLIAMYIYCFSKIRKMSKQDGGFVQYALAIVMKKYNLVFKTPENPAN